MGNDMPREASITQAQVDAVAERLRATGAWPTNRAVRDELGMGSMATIVKYLKNWRDRQPQQGEQKLTLPPAIQRTLLEFIGQEVASAKANLQADLAIAEQTNADLIVESDRQATALELQETENERLRAECATLNGRLIQLTNDLESNQASLETQRRATETARTEMARQELRLEALPKLTDQLERLQDALEKERAGRVLAEQSAAVSAARLEKTEAQVADLEGRLEQALAGANGR